MVWINKNLFMFKVLLEKLTNAPCPALPKPDFIARQANWLRQPSAERANQTWLQSGGKPSAWCLYESRSQRPPLPPHHICYRWPASPLEQGKDLVHRRHLQRESKWPQSWKKGKWVPVFKSDDPLLKENNRPVTVLPAADKVFEQIVAKQLVGMFDHRLGQALSAYRKTHSCETTLINLIENWRHARDNKHLLGILSTNMSKAFNSMHPALLLSKLRAYGFEENFINLLHSYFGRGYSACVFSCNTSRTNEAWYPDQLG